MKSIAQQTLQILEEVIKIVSSHKHFVGTTTSTPPMPPQVAQLLRQRIKTMKTKLKTKINIGG